MTPKSKGRGPGQIPIMWLKSHRERLTALHPDEIDDTVEFSDNNLAQCSREDGEQLLEMYDFVEEHEPES